MKKFVSIMLAALLIAMSAVMPVSAKNSVSLEISKDNISHEVSQTLYGAFIEDISKACDGGLAANLVYNNSFEYNDTDDDNPGFNEAYWRFNDIDHKLSDSEPMNKNNPHYELLTVSGKGTVENIGCVEDWDYKTWNPNPELQSVPDMGFKEGVKYDFSAYIKNIDFSGTIRVFLNSEANRDTVAELDTSLLNTNWTKLDAVLESAASEDGSLAIEFNGNGSLLFDFAQLIPQNSFGYGEEQWKFATLRADLAQTLVDLNPSFIRFPGGCFCEGDSLEKLFDWKETIGPVEERVQTYNVWRNDNAGDFYINSNAVGYGEYFNLCDAIGAEPLPCLNVGLTCQGRNNYDYNADAYAKLSMTLEEFKQYLIDFRGYWPDDEWGLSERVKAVNALGYKTEADWQAYLETIALTPGTPEWDAYVQDILDLIEFANGDSTTTYWGALRAAYGHEEPYRLKYLELGNENWGEVYWRNFDALYNAVKSVYPDIQIITTAGAAPSGSEFDRAWKNAGEKYTDCYVDEHYYTATSELYRMNGRYDSYDRNSSKVFVGEYACTADGYGTMQTKSNITAAVEEAAYMTGFERNGDIVAMTCYAPTFAKNNSQNWAINEIWFDSQSVAVSPSYYTQMLYTNNLGTKYIDASFSTDMPAESKQLAQSVTINEDEQVIYIKLVNSSGKRQTVDINLSGFENINCVSNQSLSEFFASACNEVGKTAACVPKETRITDISTNGSNSTATIEAERYSVNVIRIAYGSNGGETLWQLPDSIPDAITYIPLAIKIAVSSVIALIAVLAASAAIAVKIIKKRKKSRRSE